MGFDNQKPRKNTGGEVMTEELNPYYDDIGTYNQKLGRKIYREALSDRRGFRDDQIGIDSEEDVWLEIFEHMGKVARRDTLLEVADMLRNLEGEYLEGSLVKELERMAEEA
jgi:hypothetical protein